MLDTKKKMHEWLKYTAMISCKHCGLIKGSGKKEYWSEYCDDDVDPTPWCHVCGAKIKTQCDCGPRAEND